MTLNCPTASQLLVQYARFRPQPLPLVVVGLNHQTAPVHIREQATVQQGQDMQALLDIFAQHAQEAMMLTTCNRTEIYLVAPKTDPARLFTHIWGEELDPYLYVLQGAAASEHLFQVTAGLDSLVLGETQIQGQVKRAWQAAQGAGISGPILNKVVQTALAAGKRVRFETGMSDKITSVSSAAVALAKAALGQLEGRSALIIGAGETAELTLTHLHAAGLQNVMVVNRTEARAQELAQKWHGQAYPLSQLEMALPEADIVIASSAAPAYVLGEAAVTSALQKRPERDLFFIDISVPRILNPDIAAVPGAHLFNLDDLSQMVSRNLADSQAALPQAQAIVREAAADLSRWHLTRQAQLINAPRATVQAQP